VLFGLENKKKNNGETLYCSFCITMEVTEPKKKRKEEEWSGAADRVVAKWRWGCGWWRCGGYSSFLLCFSLFLLPLCVFVLFCFLSLLSFLLVVELLSTVAQGVSCGGDEEGRRWRFFSLLLCFLCFLISVSQNKSSLFFNLPSLLSLYISPPSHLYPLVFIRRKRGGERATTPVQSWHRGRVAGRPLGAALGPPEKLVPSALWSWQVRGVGFVRVWTSGRKGERENAGEKISSSLASACVGKKENNAVQDSTVLVSFFFLLLRG